MDQAEEIKLLNPQEVSKETGVGLNTVYEWFKRKDFPKVPDERINRISKRALGFWVMKIDYNQIVREAVEKEVKRDFRR
ncbi:MAG: helix-turn-helix domain-containing protein [Clostridiales bacterium]|nr:helix-turn-helix domain-containing protein [Clostridiales bacterium]